MHLGACRKQNTSVKVCGTRGGADEDKWRGCEVLGRDGRDVSDESLEVGLEE